MDSRTTIILLFLIAYLIFANDTATQLRDGDPRASLETAVIEARKLLDIIGNATHGNIEQLFGDQTTNVTRGFDHIRDYAWNALPKVQARARQHVLHALGEPGAASLDGTTYIDQHPQLYGNITGDARGEWARSPIFDYHDIPRLNMTRYSVSSPLGVTHHSRFDRNFTRSEGDVSLAFKEKELSKEASNYETMNGNITTIVAEMVLGEDTSEQEEEISLRGVYFPQIGHAILTTTSPKFAGLFALPIFAASGYTFDMSRALLNDTIDRMIAKKDDRNIALINPWAAPLGESTQQANFAPKCDMIVYLQQIPPTDYVRGHQQPLSQLDLELRYPTGAPIGAVPKMHFSMLVFSPDCGFILESRGPPDFPARESDHLQGYKRESLQSRARHHMLLYGVVVMLQLIALLRQMRESNTPSTRSRVSFYTIATMVFGDAFATIVFITISLFVETIWITIMSTAFFSLVSMLLFGMRFLSDIWAVHAPERRREEQEAAERRRRRREEILATVRERQQASYSTTAEQPSVVPAAPTSDPQTNPPPVPTVRAVDFGSISLFMPADQAGLQPVGDTNAIDRRVPTFAVIYVRFSFLLIMSLFVSISAITFPATLRRLYFTILTMIYLSFWTPQIWRNAWRNYRCALKWEFVIAQSVLRLAPVAYFFGWEGNVLFTDSHLITLTIMCVWVWLQVIVLISQEIIGPRWFVKQAWMPPAWDYHPILQLDVEGFAMPLGLSESEIASPTSPRVRRTSQSSDKRDGPQDSDAASKRVFDCAICMQELEVPIVESSAESNSSMSATLLLARRTYMVTPCRHIFHSKCLEGWIKYRMQCPICREDLPP